MYSWQVPYKCVDNFLDNVDLKFVESYFNKNMKILSGKNHFIDNIIGDTFQSTNQIEIHKVTLHDIRILDLYYKYKDKIEQIYLELNKNSNALKKPHYHNINWIITQPNREYPVHVDTPTKLLSCVLYVSKKNIGTVLYKNEKKENPYEIKWKQNKMFAFSRSEDSWHNWKSNDKVRKTLVWNIHSYD